MSVVVLRHRMVPLIPKNIHTFYFQGPREATTPNDSSLPLIYTMCYNCQDFLSAEQHALFIGPPLFFFFF